MKRIFTFGIIVLSLFITTGLKAQEVTTLKWKGGASGDLIIGATKGVNNVEIDWGIDVPNSVYSGNIGETKSHKLPEYNDLDKEYTITITTTKNTSLLHLGCFDKGLLELDISQNINLHHLGCSDNTSLSTLDLSKNQNLIYLNCYNTNLSTLDLSNNKELTRLECYNTNLSTLDLSKNQNLIYLNCHNTNLSTLDLSNNKELTRLECYDTNLSTLDLSKNQNLIYLSCHNTNLPFDQLINIDNSFTLDIFNYAPQSIFLDVSPGEVLDMEALGLYIDDAETRYLTDDEAGEGTVLKRTFTVPTNWGIGSSYNLNMWLEGDKLPEFKEFPLELTLNVNVPPTPTIYHTVDLVLAPGINLQNLSAGELTIEDGDHLFLQFWPEDPTLTADDILLLIDGVETAFTPSADGRGGSYILNPIEKDHTIEIRLREDLGDPDPNPDITGNADLAENGIQLRITNYELRIINSGPAVDVAVYNITGKNFAQLRALRGSRTIALPAGIYIVKTPDAAVKIVIP